MHVRLDAASAPCPTGTTRQGRGCSKSACPTFAARRVVSHCTDGVEKLNKVGAGAATAAAAVAGSRISFITSEPPRQLRFQINVNSNRRGIDAPIRARFSTQLPTQSKSDSNRGNTTPAPCATPATAEPISFSRFLLELCNYVLHLYVQTYPAKIKEIKI